MTTSDASHVQSAYRQCEVITRQQAKNFAYGIALLPGAKRRALSAVYAFARRIDDIGDGTLPPAEKIAALDAAREMTESVLAGAAPEDDLVLVALQDAAGRFAVPVGAFLELIEGCEADVRGVTYSTFSELEHYCRCVAGSIGRLSLGIFGSADQQDAEPLADGLGVALQLTNILRDITEDLGNGRVYLPSEDLDRFDCTLTPADAGGQGAGPKIDGAMADLIRFEAARARDWYAYGMQLLPLLDRRSAACTGAMAGIYRRLLEHIAANPQTALERRMSLPAREKASIAVSALTGIGMPRRRGTHVSRPSEPSSADLPAAAADSSTALPTAAHDASPVLPAATRDASPVLPAAAADSSTAGGDLP
jgi:phytoene synthase